jgi:glycosyltransferase involved in cell wall biosynthesis
MIGVLIMVRNEADSITATLESLTKHFKHVFLYDTGSTDDTVAVATRVATTRGLVLHTTTAPFENFATTRNKSIAWVEGLHLVSFVFLLDAGDVFRCTWDRRRLMTHVSHMPARCSYGIIRKLWRVNGKDQLHYDVRFIRLGAGCRYDEAYPVHETFAGKTTENMITFGDVATLIQDRDRFGASSNQRMHRDVAALLAAPPRHRNYYYLGQTYKDLGKYPEAIAAYKQAAATYAPGNTDHMAPAAIYGYIMECQIRIEASFDDVAANFDLATTLDPAFIDPYIWLLTSAIHHKQETRVAAYTERLARLQPGTADRTNHMFYDLTRWILLSDVCMKTGQFQLGLLATQRAGDKLPQKELRLTIYRQLASTTPTKSPESHTA